MEAFLFSTGVVALAEIGDKTQLLSFVLAAKFRKPLPIVLGILVATLVNHAAAGALGAWIASLVSPPVLRWAVGLSFLAMAVWVLVPDRLDDKNTRLPAWGVFGTAVIAFFLAEMGDKTQIATVALASHYPSLAAVVLGTTLGMLLANVPAVYFGEQIARLIPLPLVRIVTALMFIGLGLVALLGDISQLGP
ncbi:MAG: TMEM165/GDT1 family protein [Thiobacillaceae bacterium]